MPSNKSKIKNSKSQIKKPISKAVIKKTVVKPVVKKSSVVSKPKVVKSSGSTANVYNMEGKIVSKVNLPKEVFSAKVNDSLMAQAVRVYLANQRMGTASTKNRGEITGTTKKVWRQKGTGRARHGSRKAPIFVGGGVAFGPRPRDYSLKIPKKMKRAALFSALSYKQNNGEIKLITGLEKILPKTKLMAKVVKKLGFDSKKINVLLVMPDKAKNGFENVYRAGKNIEGLKILNANAINTYEVLDNQSVLFMKDAVLAVEKHFLKGEII